MVELINIAACQIRCLALYFFWGGGRCSPISRAMASSFTRFLDHTQRRTTVGRTPLNEWSARRIDLYLTTHNTHNRQTSKPPVGFEPTISVVERPQTYALDRAAAGTGFVSSYIGHITVMFCFMCCFIFHYVAVHFISFFNICGSEHHAL